MSEAGAGADNGQGGSGAPSGGSPEGGSESDQDDKFEKRIKAALASQARRYETQLGNVRSEFEAFKAGAGSGKQDRQEPKRYTRAQLNAAVTAGQITQEQADDTWAVQVREEAREDATNAALEVVDRKTKKERIDADMSAYKRLKPEIMEAGSDTRQKISEEYQYLTSIGQPKTVETELAAIRAVLGPLEKLEKSSSARRSEESEQQGGSGDGRPNNRSSRKLVDHLKGDAKDYYERGIKQGRYKDWKAVEEELVYASPKVRQRLGLPVA